MNHGYKNQRRKFELGKIFERCGIVDGGQSSNLQRQIIHQTCDVGRAKIESGRETINALNPDVQVHTYNEQVTAANIRDIIGDLDSQNKNST